MFNRYVILATAFTALILFSMAQGGDFKKQQQRFPRVRQARENVDSALGALFDSLNIKYPPHEIYLRAFKYERRLEVWCRENNTAKYRVIKSYPFTAFSGNPGPKRCQGDLQIPEGIYHIDRFNPASKYHLSLGINYPNKSDRIRKTKTDPGGDIFIHGNEVTIGCIPIGDSSIEELYILAVEARDNGQEKIPVHIYPYDFTDKETDERLSNIYKADTVLMNFWNELRPFCGYFNTNKALPKIRIDVTGKYDLASEQ
jgi:murein L,D-transpeptidase YafK